MQEKALKFTAVTGQLLALFPFVTVSEGAGFGEYLWRHYFAMYGCIILFYLFGKLAGSWAFGGGFSRRIKPLVMFASRMGFLIPAALFCIVCGLCKFHTGLYLYLLPGCIAGYFGGYLAVGKSYADIFTRGWFAAFLVSAAVGAILLKFTKSKPLYTDGIKQLCLVFGIIILISAILTNQTNIDEQTRQRSGAVLPKGARSFNIRLIIVLVGAVLALCLLAKPLGEFLLMIVKLIISLLLWLITGGRKNPESVDDFGTSEKPPLDYALNENILMEILIYLLIGGLVFLAVKFRRELINFIKDLFAPLFKVPVPEQPLPFADEFESSAKKTSSKSARKTRTELKRLYKKETDPILKFRQGYKLYLMYLSDTPFAACETDTTSAQCDKGKKAFAERISAPLSEMTDTYNRVRYGGEIPTNNELSQLDLILKNIQNGEKA